MGSNGVKEKRMKECVGKVLSSTNYGDFKIIKYVSAKEVAEKYKGQIDHRVYESLMNWKIDITD